MDKRQVASQIRRVSPMLYRVGYTLYFRLGGLLDMPRYLLARCTKRPYFGPLMLAGQTQPARDVHMRNAIRRLIEEERKEGGKERPICVLEIGSWAGQSAILWGTELVRAACPGRIFCIDPWGPFSRGTQVGINTGTLQMDRVAERDKIFPLFWHNVKSAGLAGIVLPLRCKSEDLIPYLRPGAFDLVFVDGSHAYSDFLKDLVLSAPLVRESGFMCGDDLELQRDEVDVSFAEKYRERDFVTDPKTQRDYHPGVCLGVSDFFKRRISSHDGLWIVRRNGECWTDVDVREVPPRQAST
jgi:hypothetical protein